MRVFLARREPSRPMLSPGRSPWQLNTALGGVLTHDPHERAPRTRVKSRPLPFAEGLLWISQASGDSLVTAPRTPARNYRPKRYLTSDPAISYSPPREMVRSPPERPIDSVRAARIHVLLFWVLC